MNGYCYTIVNSNTPLSSSTVSYLKSFVVVDNIINDDDDDDSNECDFIPYGFTSFVNCKNETVLEGSDTSKIMKNIISIYIFIIIKIENSVSISLLSHFSKYYSKAIDLIYNKISYMIITNNTNYNTELTKLQKNLDQLLKAENDSTIDILYIPSIVETVESDKSFDPLTFVLGLILGLIASLLILLYIYLLLLLY